jgi:hypothetical protein
MAAQALTKERFVQIIITLMVLIGAFTWRTMNHLETQFVDCKHQATCAFNVKDAVIEAEFTKQVIKLNVNNSEVNISSSLELIDSNDVKFSWKLPSVTESVVIKLTITINKEVHQVNIANYSL